MREAAGEAAGREEKGSWVRRRRSSSSGGGVAEKGRPPPPAWTPLGSTRKWRRAGGAGQGGRRDPRGTGGGGGEGVCGGWSARPVFRGPSVRLQGAGTPEAWPGSRGGRRLNAGAPEEAKSRRPISS